MNVTGPDRRIVMAHAYPVVKHPEGTGESWDCYEVVRGGRTYYFDKYLTDLCEMSAKSFEQRIEQEVARPS